MYFERTALTLLLVASISVASIRVLASPMPPNDQTHSAAETKSNAAHDLGCDFGPYAADLQRRLKRAWIFSAGAEFTKVVVEFKIHRDGSFSDVAVTKSSGRPSADESARGAVEKAGPFRPLPTGAPNDVIVTATFVEHSILLDLRK